MSETNKTSGKNMARKAVRKRVRKNGGLITLIVCCVVFGILILFAVIGWHQQLKTYRESHRFDAYPLNYTDEINSASKEFDVEPAYMYAVVLAESSFRPDAVSSVGAIGLMQIMPDTGKWLAKKLDMSDVYTQEILYDPAVNTRMGAWYLHFLLDRYNSDKRCASAAYHAGQGTVDGWLADPSLSHDGKCLDNIPYDSTNYYVDKVLKNYENYSALLSTEP